MLARLCLLLLLLAATIPARAQSGCPDPQATNYNPAATSNDGSCLYPTTATALITKATLPSAVNESSGLLYTGGSVWTHNDSGNAATLFRVDSVSGQVLQQVSISNFPNTDWEDLAASPQYVYIGDFGNNNGDRRDLRVLRVAKTDLGTSATTVTAQAINFSYPDQTDFTPRNNNHNFDCEAFFFANDSLHLFTKNWADLQTRYYTVPATPGTHVAHLKSTFNVNGLVTAAALNPAGTTAALLGYNASNGATFIWLLSGFQGTSYLKANKRRIELPTALLIGQAEGLCFVGRARVFISNEQISNAFLTVPPRLYALGLGAWVPTTALAAKTAQPAGRFTAVPNPAQRTLHIERTTGEEGSLLVQDMVGQVVLAIPMLGGQLKFDLDLSPLDAGQYVLKLQSARGVASQKITVL
ncbi:MAG: T9SS type A sorting domain-containing protein [Hymenobacter sp.]|nr:MAG: T9SS type A sorting domain-containing protein [Hymenobacter sp.]